MKIMSACPKAGPWRHYLLLTCNGIYGNYKLAEVVLSYLHGNYAWTYWPRQHIRIESLFCSPIYFVDIFIIWLIVWLVCIFIIVIILLLVCMFIIVIILLLVSIFIIWLNLYASGYLCPYPRENAARIGQYCLLCFRYTFTHRSTVYYLQNKALRSL